MATVVGQGVPAEFRQAVTEFRPPIAHEGKPLHWIDAGAGPQPVMWRMGMWWVIGQGKPVSLHQAAEWAWRYLAPVEWGVADKRIAELEAENAKLRVGIDQSIAAEMEVRLQLRSRIDAVANWRFIDDPVASDAENARLRSFPVPRLPTQARVSAELTDEDIRIAGQAIQQFTAEAAEKAGEKAEKAAPLPANALCHGWAKR